MKRIYLKHRFSDKVNETMLETGKDCASIEQGQRAGWWVTMGAVKHWLPDWMIVRVDDLPEAAEGAFVCTQCDRFFDTEHARRIHVGKSHSAAG